MLRSKLCGSTHNKTPQRCTNLAISRFGSTYSTSAAHTATPAAAPSSSSSSARLSLSATFITRSSSNDEGSSASATASQVSVAVSTPPAPAPAAAAAAPGKEALLARIAKAKAYKQGSGSSGSSAATTPTPISSSDESSSSSSELSEEQAEAMRQQYLQQLQQQQQQLSSESSSYSAYIQQTQQQQGSAASQNPLEKLEQEDRAPGARPPPARADFYTNPEAPDVQQLLTSTPKRAGSGSADEAADWLKGVLATQPDQPALDPNMRLEEFTMAKEAAVRKRGAEIITAFPEEYEPSGPPAGSDDSTSSAAVGEEGSDYKPKVTTWGMFPRPQNISEAYGGGRNIRPGQALETPEQKAKREAEYAAALQKYKAAVFTDSLSDAELAAAQATYNEGMQLFKRGSLQEALVLFDEVRGKVPLKSKLGGMSTLQAAVCYDTLGNARQAEALYKRIRGHPTSEVSRKAKQLVFGFQAMTFLKTEGLSYAVKKEDYLKYFRRAADRNRMYVASDDEKAADQAEATKAALVAVCVVLGPVIIMGALLASSKLG